MRIAACDATPWIPPCAGAIAWPQVTRDARTLRSHLPWARALDSQAAEAAIRADGLNRMAVLIGPQAVRIR
ncbi:hypothetical protein D5039_08800 [Verminephrobacter aporrectodeae subsp. tuberculatae]|uniref:Uncharacterized protein n=1 Tax=Verminephrobacter aporrectodeae subsp. tuberculatae TaxID=1110392 RepID=A0ABT3KSG2_9BURK|nr:hypothetical protein [Verminephrobacter aporrectodeae subsp. tuberculatae]